MSQGPPVKPGAALRRAMARSCVAMPGAFNAGVARLVERAGFEAVYVSGAGLANGAGGVPDIGLLGLPEVAQPRQHHTGRVQATEQGHGNSGEPVAAREILEQGIRHPTHLDPACQPGHRC